MEIRRYISLLLHWWWLIALVVIISGGTAYLVSINTTPIYGSTARLLVDEAPGDESYADVLRIEKIKATYVELITFQPVMAQTAEALAESGIDIDPTTLAGMVSASSEIDTQLMSLSVIDTNPDRAAQIADEVANQFIIYLKTQQGQRFEEALLLFDTERDNVGQLIEDIEANINALSAQEDTLTSDQTAELSLLQTQLKEQQNIYNTIFNDSQALRVQAATSTTNVLVVEPAAPNTNPLQPRTLNNTFLALIVGGLISVGFILLIDYLNDTIRTPDQLQEMIGRQALGVIPFIKSNAERDETLITHIKPRDPTSEAFRILRTNLEFMSIDEKLKRLIMTSPSPSEGKSTTIANLAAVLAQAGNRVILVDADLRKPSQHKIFSSTTNSQGLTTALLDSESPLHYHVQSTQVPGLSIMTSGPLPPNPAELLGSNRMEQILTELEETNDIILIDTPPTLTVADAAILTPKATGVAIVARIGQTREDALAQALQSLGNTGAKLFGVILNRATASDGGYYYNAYYYRYYTYEYGQKQPRANSSNARRWLPQWLTSLLG